MGPSRTLDSADVSITGKPPTKYHAVYSCWCTQLQLETFIGILLAEYTSGPNSEERGTDCPPYFVRPNNSHCIRSSVSWRHAHLFCYSCQPCRTPSSSAAVVTNRALKYPVLPTYLLPAAWVWSARISTSTNHADRLGERTFSLPLPMPGIRHRIFSRFSWQHKYFQTTAASFVLISAVCTEAERNTQTQVKYWFRSIIIISRMSLSG